MNIIPRRKLIARSISIALIPSDLYQLRVALIFS
nr:MAG TPA_asm: hypothetical protein [Bacteriophage sp.]